MRKKCGIPRDHPARVSISPLKECSGGEGGIRTQVPGRKGHDRCTGKQSSALQVHGSGNRSEREFGSSRRSRLAQIMEIGVPIVYLYQAF